MRENVARVRREQGLTLRDVADRLSNTERPIAHNTISEIERGARRVDVDDLMALAAALSVSPVALLFPSAESAETAVHATGFGEVAASQLWTSMHAPPSPETANASWWSTMIAPQMDEQPADLIARAITIVAQGAGSFKPEDLVNLLVPGTSSGSSDGDD
ncbi:helix-turn-helix domain-containing protein [Rhodococcoides corynebacterioides]|uniref:helix-turn-helix domain-containing protein n=1 Tax=Rhodococcoides corynebacterioides TaxID=53972 RepID=UPI000835F2BE|nr:helix-turn-helix transcriptional regulator [Rhodococcus corynebacterioides]